MTMDDLAALPTPPAEHTPPAKKVPYPRRGWVAILRGLLLLLLFAGPLYVGLFCQALIRHTLHTIDRGLLDPPGMALCAVATVGSIWALYDSVKEWRFQERQKRAKPRIPFAVETENAWRQKLAEARASNDRGAEVKALSNVGFWLMRQDRHAEAEPVLRDALTLARQLNNRYEEERVLTYLAHCARARGDLETAERLYRESLTISLALMPADMPYTYHLGPLEEAAESYEVLGRLLAEQPGRRVEGCQMLARAEARYRAMATREQKRFLRRHDIAHADELRDLRRSLGDESDAGAIG